MSRIFKNGKIILEDRIVEDKLIVFDDKIIDITDSYDFSGHDVIDLNGKYVSPGFIDIHIHGSNGSDVMDGTIEALETISESVSRNGVTSFLATTMTQSHEDIEKSFDAVKSFMDRDDSKGAKIVGIHVEGPFINKDYKGAQNGDYIIPPDKKLVGKYLDYIKLLTVAPEVDGMVDFVVDTKEKNDAVKFSIGHSGATYEQAMKAYNAGIDSTTHTFNGMTGLHHRKPGIVGAVLMKKPYFEIIADDVHLHSAIYGIMGDCVGVDKMILVTDAMCACNMKPGVYELGGQKVVVDADSARLTSGNLAGSVLKLNLGIHNVLKSTDFKLNEVVNMATINPANMLGLDDVGKIEKGFKADFAVFDEQLNIDMTIVDGRVVYREEK